MHEVKMSLNTTDCIMILENFIPQEKCDEIIQLGENWIQNDVIHDNALYRQNTAFRQDIQLLLPHGFLPTQDFYPWTQEMALYATSLYGSIVHSAISISPISRVCKWQKTEKNQKGFSTWHVEQFSGTCADRCLVWMLYLNDVDEGGATEFLYQGKMVTPKQGTFVMWPAGVTHPHRGNPPYSNDKYVLTGWMSVATDIEYPTINMHYESMAQGDYSYLTRFQIPDTVMVKK